MHITLESNDEFSILEEYLKKNSEVYHSTLIAMWSDLVCDYMSFLELHTGFIICGKCIGISPTADREIKKLLKFKDVNPGNDYDF